MLVININDNVLVENVNISKKHFKKTANSQGDRVKFEAPISVTNVMLICPQCSKAARVGYQVPEEGKKVRICKKCNAAVDQSFSKKKTK